MVDSLLKEVDDALKWQRLQQWWQRAGQQIVLGLSLAVIALIALLFYRQEERAQMQLHSDLLLSALTQLTETTPPPAAELEQNLNSSELSGPLAQLAALALAPRYAAEGEIESASQTLNAAADSATSASPLLSELACLQRQALKVEGCDEPALFAALSLEYRTNELIQQDDLIGAYQTLQTSSGDNPLSARLALLQDYLRSHVPELPAVAEPANDLPSDDAR